MIIVMNKYTTVAILFLVLGIICIIVGYVLDKISSIVGIVFIAIGIVGIIVSLVFYVLYRIPGSRPYSKK